MRRYLGLAACLLLASQSATSAANGDGIYARPGVRYSTGSGSLNFYCMGSGTPAVVFDQGWGDWSPAWAVVQPQVATFTRARSYDRAGYGFSEPGPTPRTSVRVAEELHAALHNAGISPPYILVAAAFGSYGMRVFADRYMPEVAGIVLSDADDGDVEPAKWQMRIGTIFRGSSPECAAAETRSRAVRRYRPHVRGTSFAAYRSKRSPRYSTRRF